MKTSADTSGRPDALRALAAARPDALDPARLSGSARQREDLARILSEVTDRDSAPAPRGRPALLKPLGAVAALTAVAATAVIVTGVDERPAPAGRPEAVPRSSATAVTDARLVLLSAATKAAAAPSEGTYWRTESRSEVVDVVGKAGHLFAVRDVSSSQWSVGVRKGTESLLVSGLDSTVEPRTAADKRRWRDAGSPGTVEATVSSSDDGPKRAYTLGTGHPTVDRTALGDRIYALGPRNVTYKELRRLPTGTAELRRLLERLSTQDGVTGQGAQRSAWLLRVTADLVTMPVEPGVRAAAYRVMADLPGVRLSDDVSDPLGRKGVGVTFPGTDRTPLGRVRERLVVDPSTGELLADETLLAEPSARAREAGLKAGTAVNYSATTEAAWSEDQITVPGNARH
ncbi:CU044_5270 family protein [Streptomyces sp. NPDC001904]|uniref:CU044_5270 family protein n=1 Tax=Streptomyces sp. NPDC001904 TaxID=3154531 RepID=UPI0033339F71